MTDAYDYSADAEPVGDNLLRQISLTALDQVAAQNAVIAAEAEVERLELALKVIKEQTLPSLMEAARQTELTTFDDLVVKVEHIIRAAIKEEMPEDQKAAAFKWLEDNGHGSVIKNLVVVEFGKEQNAEAAKLVEALSKMGLKAPVMRKKTVHHSTLTSLVRELLSSDDESKPQVPLDLLGGFDRIETSVKPKKSKRK
jgi:hypothetical protein